MKKVKLGDYVEIKTGKLDANVNNPTGKYPFFTCSVNHLMIDEYAYDCECVLVAGNGDLNIKYYNGKFNAYQRTYIIESLDNTVLNVRYLYYFMNSYIDILRQNSIGGVIKYIKLGDLTDAIILLPTLEVQKKIVEALDKAQSLIDMRKKQIEFLDELVHSVFTDMFGDPVTNPKGWNKKSLGELGEWKSGGTPQRSNREFFEGSIPWLTSGELEFIYTFSSAEYITEEAIKQSAAKIIKPNSLLLGMYDTAALKSTIVKVEATCNQAIAFSYLNEEQVNTIFVYYCVQYGREHFKRLQRGVRQKNLNLSMIKAIEIIFPLVEKQNEFAALVDKVLVQNSLFEKSLLQLQTNFNSIIQKAFRGELFN